MTDTAGALVLAAPFTDHAVLQRDKPVPVWGWATPGDTVTVQYRGQSHETAAGESGWWEIWLDPMSANGEGADMVATGKSTIVLHDVVVGEVWLCSGQSNMTWSVDRADNAEAEIAAAQHPLLRHFGVALTTADEPADMVAGTWQKCSPATVGAFSAVGYYFGRDLWQKLNVPIGVVRSGWGGTPIESWLSQESLTSDPAFDVVHSRWQELLEKLPENQAAFDKVVAARAEAEAVAKAAGEEAHREFLKKNPPPVIPPSIRPSSAPASLFNGMINPLLPYAIRGVLWYQGESNTPRAGEYYDLFFELITSWRMYLEQGDIPFYWVQLPNFIGAPDADWARLREAQTKALALPNTAQAVTIDVGNRDDVHPTNKQAVGRRLALIVKARDYGIACESSGPIFARAVREGSAFRVFFEHAEGLCVRGDSVASVEIAGADHIFHPARAVIENTELVASSPEVKNPEAVRYAWSNAPVANLFNSAGLPAAPFRSGNWD